MMAVIRSSQFASSYPSPYVGYQVSATLRAHLIVRRYQTFERVTLIGYRILLMVLITLAYIAFSLWLAR